MQEKGISVQDVWKKFHRGELHDSLRDLIPAVVRGFTGRRRAPSLDEGDFWALQEISFDVRPGDALGIIGPNGAGKSTILKLLNRILRPTRGTVTVQGRVGALIEIAAGFHPDLTGRENVYLQGSIMGMRRAEIARRFDEIVEFAGLGEFMDMPVKRYSSGMNARLGFAIAAHLEVDVLLIDEVLAVGDFDFQQRAFSRLQSLARSGIPVVVVSHQLERVAALCTQGILLRKGRIVTRGTPTECIEAYVRPETEHARAPDASRPAQITGVESPAVGTVESGDWVRMAVHVRYNDASLGDRMSVWFHLRSLQTGGTVFATGTSTLGLTIPDRGSFRVQAALQLNVPPGSYSLECHLWDRVELKQLDIGSPSMLTVRGGPAFMGTVQLNPDVEVIAEEA